MFVAKKHNNIDLMKSVKFYTT